MPQHFSDEVLALVRGLPLALLLERLRYHIAIDRDFIPAKDARSQRWIVSCEQGSTELLVTGQKWYDTRVACGGGGSVDLVMHLENRSFVSAVKRIKSILKT